MLIRGGHVLEHNRLAPEHDLRIVAGQVAAIGRNLPAEAGEPVLEAQGCYVLPGFIDLHTHGVRDASPQDGAWLAYSGFQAEHGVTSCLPTLFGPVETLLGAMVDGLATTESFRRTPNLAGFRLEMPYLAKPGAGKASSLVQLSAGLTGRLHAAGDGCVRIWDVAPELDGALDFIRWAAQHGIVTSLAHSHASPEEARRAVDAGLSLVTHFYDTFDLAVQSDPGVYPAGLTDYIQIEDRLCAEIIPDGVHVHPFLVEKTLRCKGIERVAFVTDSVRGAGNPPGIYSGLYPDLDVEVTVDRGVRRVDNGDLSGSSLTMLRAFQNAVNMFGRSIPDASALCSRTPARVLGLARKGYLARGMDADVVVLDHDLRLRATVVGGQALFESS